jgi:hypothetical protein
MIGVAGLSPASKMNFLANDETPRGGGSSWFASPFSRYGALFRLRVCTSIIGR